MGGQVEFWTGTSGSHVSDPFTLAKVAQRLEADHAHEDTARTRLRRANGR